MTKINFNKLFLTLFLGLFLGTAWCVDIDKNTQKNEKVVKIAYLPITHSLALLKEAKELESKNGVKIELVRYGSWPELLDALNSGKVDGASVLIELAMK